MTAAAVVLAGTVIAGTLLTAAPASASCSVTDLDCVPGAPVPTTPKPATANSIKFSYQLAQLPTATPGQVGGPDMDVTNESTTSPVVLSGCGSVAIGATYPGISAYEWTVGSAAPVYTSTCQWTWQRPVSAAGGSTPVTLTVIPTKGTPFSSTKTISYRDVVIASVGDSAASGQGAFQYNISPRCYRSGYAASAQAALHAQQTLGSAVTVHFWFLACSGARITSADAGPWMTTSGPGSAPADWGGMLTPYTGAKNPNPPAPQPAPLTPQVTRLTQLRAQSGLPISTLLMTIGANDTGWSIVAENCLTTSLVALAGVSADIPEGICLATFQAKVGQSVATLPAHFATLGSQLNAVVPAGRVYLTDYFDPEDSLIGPSPSCPGEVVASYTLRQWAITYVENPLQRAVQAAAAANGWHYLTGIRQAFQGHGVCNPDTSPNGRWVDSILDSKLGQNDINGTWHANTYGQNQIAAIEYPTVLASINGG